MDAPVTYKHALCRDVRTCEYHDSTDSTTYSNASDAFDALCQHTWNIHPYNSASYTDNLQSNVLREFSESCAFFIGDVLQRAPAYDMADCCPHAPHLHEIIARHVSFTRDLSAGPDRRGADFWSDTASDNSNTLADD